MSKTKPTDEQIAEAKAAKANAKEAAAPKSDAKPVKLVQPWNKLSTLSEEQKSKIADIHKKATEAINEYKVDKAEKREHGLEACADCYLQTYAEEFEDRVYLRVYPEVVGMAENSVHFRRRAQLFMS